MLARSLTSWGGLPMLVLAILIFCANVLDARAEANAESFRTSLASENLNVAALQSSLTGPDYERYLEIVVEEFENGKFDGSEKIRANAYEILLIINSANEVLDPRVWQRVPKDLSGESDSVRAKAAVLARFAPMPFRFPVLDELENSLALLDSSVPSFKPVLESYVLLFEEKERSVFEMQLKPILEKTGVDRGLRIVAFQGAIKSLGLLDATNYIKSQGIDIRVDGAQALSQVKAEGKHFGTREEESAIRSFLTETGVEYLSSKRDTLSPSPVEEKHERREIAKAIVLALLRTLGADPQDTSAAQLLVNKEVVGSLKKVQACLEGEDLAKAIEMGIQKFSEDGVLRGK